MKLSHLLTTTFLLTTRLTDASSSFTPTALQMGPDKTGSSFASAAVYHAATNRLIITGSTAGRDFDADSEEGDTVPGAYRCFIGVLIANTGQWTQQTTLGHAGNLNPSPNRVEASQTCSNAVVLNNGGGGDEHIILTGHAGNAVGGVLDSLYERQGVQENVRYGTLLDLAAPSTLEDYEVTGGAVLQGSAAVYPMSIASSPAEPQNVYVASMFSDQGEDSDSSDNFLHLPVDPNLIFPVGRTFGMTVEGYEHASSHSSSSQKIERTLIRRWREYYVPASRASVAVAGVVQVSSEVLVVAGHTVGQGQGFGVSAASPNVSQDSPTQDGFVTKLRAATGHLYDEEDDPYRSTFRIESTNAGQEEIHGLCHAAHGVNGDPDVVYVVGSTTGDLERTDVSGNNDKKNKRQAFLMKLQLSTMQPVWTKQLADPTGAAVRGISCAVTRDGATVWWAGHVENGRLEGSNALHSFGEIDVFVAQLQAETGQVQFVRQIGSEADDLLANRGGLAVDLDGSALVVGNTFGSLFRQKGMEPTDVTANVFVMTISRYNGDMVSSLTHPDNVAPVPAVPQPTPAAPHPSPPHSEPASLPTTIDTGDSGSKDWVLLLFTLLVLIAATVCCAAMYYRHKLHSNDAPTDRKKVLRYLNRFDVEDVDLKHSATGGWHCSYTNGLAQGEVRRSSGSSNLLTSPRAGGSKSSMMDPLTGPVNDRILKDSLFMDEDDDDVGLEYGGSRSMRNTDVADSSGYDGLVDAYNRTWKDRSPTPKKEKRSARNNSGGDRAWGRPIV